MSTDSIGQLAYLLLLLVAVGGWLAVEFRGRAGFAMRTALAWGLIFLGVAAGYGLWGDIRSQITPVQAIGTAGRIEVPRAADGHYYLVLRIGGTPVRFMVDTGATNVVLSQRDARRLGIDPAALLYMGEASTANGLVRTARVKLSDVALGPVVDRSLTAWVTDGEMPESLLGMDYLGRFSVEISGARMILAR